MGEISGKLKKNNNEMASRRRTLQVYLTTLHEKRG
jgi:hypothetical protein